MNTENKIINALTQCNLSEDVIIFHILPWIKQIEFREQTIPRMLIDYTRVENPNLFIAYNQLNTFDASLSIPLIMDQMKLNLHKHIPKIFKVLKYSGDYVDLDKLSFFLLMLGEIEGEKEHEDSFDKHKAELLSDEWDFSEYDFYLKTLCDKRFSDQLFDKLLIDHKFLLDVK